MNTEQPQPQPTYNSELSSVIFDKFDQEPVAVALKEDVAAYAERIGYLGKTGTAAMSELFNAQPMGKLLSVGMRQTEHFAAGKVLETSRTNIRRPEHTHGLRLSSLDVILEQIDQKERGEPSRLHRFGPAYTKILRGFADAVLL